MPGRNKHKPADQSHLPLVINCPVQVLVNELNRSQISLENGFTIVVNRIENSLTIALKHVGRQQLTQRPMVQTNQTIILTMEVRNTALKRKC